MLDVLPRCNFWGLSIATLWPNFAAIVGPVKENQGGGLNLGAAGDTPRPFRFR